MSLNEKTLAEWQRLADEATPGPLLACRLDADTKAEAAKYVTGCIETGGDAFYLVLAETPDGARDACHTGNGPASWANAQFFAAAREAVPALLSALARAEARAGEAEAERDEAKAGWTMASRDYMRLRESTPADAQTQATLLGQRDALRARATAAESERDEWREKAEDRKRELNDLEQHALTIKMLFEQRDALAERAREARWALEIVAQPECSIPPDCADDEEYPAMLSVADMRRARAALASPETPAADTLPAEIREILRDVANGVFGRDLSGRAAAAIVKRDLCPRCADTGMELLDAPGALMWGMCHGCAPSSRSEER